MQLTDCDTLLLQKVQEYIDTHDIYRVIWPYYDYNYPFEYGKWIPLKTERINILEVMKNAKETR